MATCPNCGSTTEEDSVYCAECGYQLTKKEDKQVSQTSKPDPTTGPKKIKFVRQKK